MFSIIIIQAILARSLVISVPSPSFVHFSSEVMYILISGVTRREGDGDQSTQGGRHWGVQPHYCPWEKCVFSHFSHLSP